MSVERIACPKCGSNNFATQARCWSCATPLSPATAPAQPGYAAAVPPQSAAHSGLSIGAAVALGLLFPAIAVPVGIVFLMLDDKRKAQIGWHNILWGTVGTVLHILVTMALSAMITPILVQTMTRAAGQARGGLPQGFPGQ